LPAGGGAPILAPMPNTKPKKGSGARPSPSAPKARSRNGASRAKTAAAPSSKGTRRAAAPARPSKASPKPASQKADQKRTRPTVAPAVARGRRKAPAAVAHVPVRPVPAAGLSDEEQILEAKYLPRELPPRVFEEERFLFPETYEIDRVRLLVKDPEWVFAYWDVNPQSLSSIGRAVGERAMALSRLTLRVSDPQHGGSTDVLLPEGARWWYVRTDTSARSYRAALGVTLPSGEFRLLAESNTVTSPRLGPSTARAGRRVSARGGAASSPASASASYDATAADDAAGGDLGPWNPSPEDLRGGPAGIDGPERAIRGASDAFRPGGASDAFRR